MADLISRAAALDAIDFERKALIEQDRLGAEHVVVHHARRLIEELPVVDAVPVVRCKDCKYWYAEIGASTGWLPCHEIATDRNWFCGSGKWKDDEVKQDA